MQFISAGMPRTGSQSLKKALEILGYRTYGMGVCLQYYSHLRAWRDHAEGKKKLDFERLLGRYDATVGVPCCFYYREMMEAFPEARVILCLRDPERWFRSFDNLRTLVFKVGGRLWFLPRIRLFYRTVYAFMFRGFFGERYDQEHVLARLQRHNKEVREFVPAEKLLVFDVKEGWEPLCKFVGKPVPDVPFPHVNKSQSVVKKRIALALSKDLGYLLLFVAAVYAFFWLL